MARMATVKKLLDKFLRRKPRLGRQVYIARGAVVLGDVRLGDQASVWYNAVLRADINRIRVGRGSNIQDNCVLHLAEDHPCILGDYVTVGHAVVLHGCTVGDECLIGMGAVVLDGAVIGAQSIVGAKALVTQGARIPPGSLVLGAPARVARALSATERARIKIYARHYVENGAYCLRLDPGQGSSRMR
jgi:carbonic anhydrase/acetyltransferase-like protein (isoleucine patch superfamily)